MRSDPEPEYAIRDVYGERAVMNPHADRVEALHALEAERRMLWIRFQQRELLIRELPDYTRERLIALPETRRRVVRQSFRERPAA